jgi:hypothetical protein
MVALGVTHTDTFEVRELWSRQYGIHVTPDTVIEATVTVTDKLKHAQRDLFHVHRNDPQKELRKHGFVFRRVPDIEVKETEARIVM